jgi:hypothetical protein
MQTKFMMASDLASLLVADLARATAFEAKHEGYRRI